MPATKGAGNIAVTYNSNALDAYLNQASLQATVNELEATDFDSASQEADPGLSSWSIDFNGDWSAALDAIIGPDAITSTKRTVAVAITDSGSNTVTYTWTSQGFVTGYNPTSDANGKIAHSATLRLSGAPSRS